MKRLGISVGAFLSGALLAACAGNHGLSSATSFVPTGTVPLGKASGTEKVLYSFKGSPDGQLPDGTLLNKKGVLYGTTQWGGSATCVDYSSSPGCGTLFQYTPASGAYQQLYAFPASGLGGDLPVSGLTSSGAVLYGTTDWGGGKGLSFEHGCYVNNGCGTAFAMKPDGKFHVIHKFNGRDGYNLNPGVIAAGGMLYGAALGGGSGSCLSNTGCGLVFSMTRSGKENPLHDFRNGNDGNAPIFGPIDVNGTLYGTTWLGGGTSCAGPSGFTGCGTIYKINAKGGGYKVLYRFQGGNDGANPISVFAVDGTLYGTTSSGGGASCPQGYYFSGCGTIFKINPDGTGYEVIYRFQGGSDGWSPNNIAADINGTLYGTTSYGGGYGCGGNGCGTVFKIGAPSSSYGIVSVFKGGSDGALPNSGVIAVNETLYGTTTSGGGYGCGGGGCGTVYEVSP